MTDTTDPMILSAQAQLVRDATTIITDPESNWNEGDVLALVRLMHANLAAGHLVADLVIENDKLRRSAAR